jgi:hypothetical protein
MWKTTSGTSHLTDMYKTRALLTVLYPLLLLARLVNRLFGRDPLVLKRPTAEKTGWIERHVQPDVASYFTESSPADCRSGPSAAKPLIFLLHLLARLYRPPRRVPGTNYEAAADREQEIPEEAYTLW